MECFGNEIELTEEQSKLKSTPIHCNLLVSDNNLLLKTNQHEKKTN